MAIAVERWQHSPLPFNHIVASFFYQPPWVNECALEYLYNNLTTPCPQPGLNVEMFIFMMSMLNCTFDIKVASGMGSPNVNGYWSGMLGMVSRGEANMSVNTAYQTQLRGDVVNYMNPNGNSKVAVLISKKMGGLQADTLFLPFSYMSWALIFGSLGLVTGLTVLMVFFHQRFISKEPKPPGTFMREIGRAIEECVSAPIHHGHEVRSSDPYKHLLVGWQFTMLVVGMMYGEALYAFFAKPPTFTVPFKDVDGFATALLNGNYKLMVPAGIHQFMKNVLATSSVPGMLKLKRAIETMPVEEIANEERFNGPKYIQTDTAFLDINMAQGMMVARNCAVTMIDLVDMEGNFYAPVFTKSFPYIEQFNLFTDLQLQYYARLEYVYATSVTPAPCDFALGLVNLNLGHLWMTFQICGLGLLISSCIFASQHLLKWKAGKTAVGQLGRAVDQVLPVSRKLSVAENVYRNFFNEEISREPSVTEKVIDIDGPLQSTGQRSPSPPAYADVTESLTKRHGKLRPITAGRLGPASEKAFVPANTGMYQRYTKKNDPLFLDSTVNLQDH